nr:MAG TPA: hypothetical protein [Caudoviricetes sp.]
MAKFYFATSNLSMTKIINSNVVVIIIVLAWFVSTRKVMFRFEE